MRTIPKIFAVALGALLLAACSRGGPNTSQLHLNLGDVASVKFRKNALLATSAGSSALGNDSTSLVNLVVNITGTGIDAPIYYQWQATCSLGATCGAPPSDVELMAPRGSSRLVQVLAQYADGLTFRYGQVSQDFSAPAIDLTIEINPIQAVASQAHVVGRVLNGGTGELQGRFQPPNGAPPMLILRGAMFAGWFDIVALSGAAFSYTYNGNALLPNFSLDSANLTGSGQNFTRIHAPSFTRTDGVNAVTEPEQDFVLGFFNGTTQIACYPDTDSTILSAGLGANTTLLSYSGTAALSSSVVTHRNGGVAASTNPICTSGATLFTDHLVFNEQALRNGRAAVGGFSGPWRLNANLKPVVITPGSTSAAVGWNFLPDTTSGPLAIAGVSVLARDPSRTDGIYAGSNVACSRRADLGFAEFNNIPMTPGVTSGQVTIDLGYFNAQVILCPYVNVAGLNVFPDAGVEVNLPANATTNAAAQSIKLTSTAVGDPSPNTQTAGTCQSYSVGVVDANGTAVVPTQATPISFSLPSGYDLYTSDCLTEIMSGPVITVAANSASAAIGLKVKNTPGLSLITTYAGTAPSIVLGQTLLASVGTSPTAAASLSLKFDPNQNTTQMVVGKCYPFSVALLDSTSLPTFKASGFSAYFTVAAVSAGAGTTATGTFYESSYCQGAPITTSTIPSSNALRSYSFRPATAGTGAMLSVTAGSLNPGQSNAFAISAATP